MSQYQRREDLTIIPDLLGLAACGGECVHGVPSFDGARGRRHSPEIPRTDRARRRLHHPVRLRIDAHTEHARANGASKQEIAEAAFVAAAVKAGETLVNSLMALRIFDEEERAG